MRTTIPLEIICQTEANSMCQHNARIFLISLPPSPQVFTSRRLQILKQRSRTSDLVSGVEALLLMYS